jgi:hypothetical protein
MKKFLFLLGCMLMLCIPQAQPTERDIGSFGFAQDPCQDFNFALATECHEVFTAPEFVVQVIDRSPGVQSEELASTALSVLRAESADQINLIALPEADVTDLFFQDRNRQCTKTRLVKSYAIVTNVLSTSNGGSGY